MLHSLSRLGLVLPVLDLGKVGPSPSVRSLLRLGLPASASDLLRLEAPLSPRSSARSGSSASVCGFGGFGPAPLLRAPAQPGTAFSAFGSSRLGLAALVSDSAALDSLLPSQGLAQPGTWAPALSAAELDSSLLPRSLARAGSLPSTLGCSCAESSLPAPDAGCSGFLLLLHCRSHPGALLLLSSRGWMGTSLLVPDFGLLGSSAMSRGFAWCGSVPLPSGMQRVEPLGGTGCKPPCNDWSGSRSQAQVVHSSFRFFELGIASVAAVLRRGPSKPVASDRVAYCRPRLGTAFPRLVETRACHYPVRTSELAHYYPSAKRRTTTNQRVAAINSMYIYIYICTILLRADAAAADPGRPKSCRNLDQSCSATGTTSMPATASSWTSCSRSPAVCFVHANAMIKARAWHREVLGEGC